MANPIAVVAGILQDEQGRILLTSRPLGRAMAGYWEFPGGKLENGETHAQALERELHEELGIQGLTSRPWLTREYHYPHARVAVHFRHVTGWQGRVTACEGQGIHWQILGDAAPSPLLPANQPVFKWLTLPPVYALTRAAEVGEEQALEQLRHGFSHGLRLVQVREKGMAASAAICFVEAVVREARRWGARVMVNGETAGQDVDGVQGIHLTSRQLLMATERPSFPWVAASCHEAREVVKAAELGLDFAVLGPVQVTRSHPDQWPLGWAGFAESVREAPLPLYAIGGMAPTDVWRAREMGAQGVAMLRQWSALGSSGDGGQR